MHVNIYTYMYTQRHGGMYRQICKEEEDLPT